MRARPMVTGRALAALTTLVAVATAGLLAVAGVAGAEPAAGAGGCVTLVLDGRLLDGAPAQVRCVRGDPTSGFDTLARAGVSLQQRPRDGIVCRIQGRPQQCTATTSSTYWSYWVRAPGATAWRYATEGAATRDPRPCSGEAWVWQDGGRVPPPRVPASTGCSASRSSSPPAASPSRSSGSGGTPPPAATHAASATSTTGRTAGTAGPAQGSRGDHSPGRPTSPTTAGLPLPTGPASGTASETRAPDGSSATAGTQPPSDRPTASDPVVPAGAEPPADPGRGALTGGTGAAVGAALVLLLATATVVRGRRARHPSP